MSKIFITGDTHGDFRRFSSKSFPEGKNLTKQDYVIICGDFGGIWSTYAKDEENYWLDWLNKKPWTTLFLDGNHENHSRLDVLYQIEKFGSTVGQVRDYLFHLKRGEVYIIDDKKFFVFGGGFSIDKASRMPHVSWWEQEMPNYTQYANGLAKLEQHDNKVDYILTHTCSMAKFNEMAQKHAMYHKIADEEKPLRKYFDAIEESVEYKKWYCGHFHIEDVFGKVEFLYQKIKIL